VRRLFFNLLAGLAYDLEGLGAAARQNRKAEAPCYGASAFPAIESDQALVAFVGAGLALLQSSLQKQN